jgi:alkylated DNA repair protein (DNA oxidative demethylase)
MDLEDFRYFEEAISPEEEAKLLSFVEALPFRPYVMRGQPSRRDIVRFGHDYGPVGGPHHIVEPLTPELIELRATCAKVAGFDGEPFSASVVTRYQPGATIGWHSDMTMFGPMVFGVSLLSSVTFKLRPKNDPRKVLKTILQPRSLYLMQGKIRSDWDHSIPPVKSLRYSITFRTPLK